LKLTFRAIDGAAVAVEHPTTPLKVAVPATSSMQLLVDNFPFELVSGRIGFAREAAQRGAGVELTETLNFGGGTLHLGHVHHQVTRTAAVWEGRHGSLYGYFVDRTTAEIVRLLSVGKIRDEPSGLAFVPASSSPFVYKQRAGLIVEIAEIGLLNVRQIDKEMATQLPSHSGTQVGGGELFAVPGAGSARGHDSFLLLDQHVGCNVQPPPHRSPDDVVALLADLRVQWIRS
jgi:hypothetical protein